MDENKAQTIVTKYIKHCNSDEGFKELKESLDYETYIERSAGLEELRSDFVHFIRWQAKNNLLK